MQFHIELCYRCAAVVYASDYFILQWFYNISISRAYNDYFIFICEHPRLQYYLWSPGSQDNTLGVEGYSKLLISRSERNIQKFLLSSCKWLLSISEISRRKDIEKTCQGRLFSYWINFLTPFFDTLHRKVSVEVLEKNETSACAYQNYFYSSSIRKTGNIFQKCLEEIQVVLF